MLEVGQTRMSFSRVQRTLRPREIVIRTTYEQTLDLPFVHRTFTLTPEVKSRLWHRNDDLKSQ